MRNSSWTPSGARRTRKHRTLTMSTDLSSDSVFGGGIRVVFAPAKGMCRVVPRNEVTKCIQFTKRRSFAGCAIAVS
jgi:hypothetical protein